MKNNLSIYIILCLAFCVMSCQKIAIVKAPGAVDQENFIATFPFEIRQGIIVMEVILKGKSYEFVLDTGGFNLIDKKIADDLGISGKTSIDIPDSQGNEKEVPLLKLDQMGIAGINFLKTGTGIVEFDDLNAIGCLELKGMIGSNLMQNAIWEIDYQRQEITITHSKEQLDIPNDAYVIPFNTSTFKSPNIELRINGQVEEEVEIDLGSNGSFNLLQSSLDQLVHQNSVSGRGLYKAGLYGYGKAETINFARIDELSLGSMSVRNQIVNFKQQGTSTIGNAFLKDYRVIFDWFENELTLIPVETPEDSSLETFGFRPIFNNQKPLIGFIYDNSSAAQVGLDITDEIVDFDGQNTQNISQANWCEVKQQLEETTKETISISVMRGSQILEFELEKTQLF